MEFPAELEGTNIVCPHCQKVTALGRVKPESPKMVKADPQHGVFYYVFFGVLSLGLTLFILGAGCLLLGIGIPAFIGGRDRAERIELNPSGEISETNNAGAVSAEKADCISKSLSLYDISVRYQNSELNGRVPGVEFKLKNLGERTLTKVGVTVYFLDSDGKTIAENKFNPVWVTSYGGENNDPSKPGYIWALSGNQFYVAKNVPSEWVEGRVIVKVTDVEFAK
jgi:hypothetical protein